MSCSCLRSLAVQHRGGIINLFHSCMPDSNGSGHRHDWPGIQSPKRGVVPEKPASPLIPFLLCLFLECTTPVRGYSRGNKGNESNRQQHWPRNKLRGLHGSLSFRVSPQKNTGPGGENFLVRDKQSGNESVLPRPRRDNNTILRPSRRFHGGVIDASHL